MAKGKAVCKHPDLKRESGYLYFLDKKGNLARVKMARGGKKKKAKPKQEVLHKCGLEREPGMLYYVGKDMSVMKTKMAKPGSKKKKKKAVKKKPVKKKKVVKKRR